MENIKHRNEKLINASLWFFIIATILVTTHYFSDIISPLIFATLYSIVVMRIVDKLETFRYMNRSIAIISVLLLSALFIMALIYLLGNQVAGYFDDLPSIEKNLQGHWLHVQGWIHQHFGIDLLEQ